MENQNAGGSSASNGGNAHDMRANLEPVLNHIQKCLGNLHQLHLTVSSFSTTSQLSLLERINSLVVELDEMQKSSDNCDIQVPLEVIRLIDDGKNPDEFTKDVINRCIQKNQVTKGKSEVFKNLRKELLEELDKEFPDEVEAYRELRMVASNEAKKQAQPLGSLPNGDSKMNT
eukprot:TRINITY_DN29126_c0_g1_i1.p1 TRINITY_DN29126_c0_g1~~TRINITY_DN29126_c0_g1_i1.p1  ORF type:complete len:173 (+),score=47.42 TRINITY_DN29126_c0_g1_i1:286-804(+)